MKRIEASNTVRLDLNNPLFQENLLSLPKPERHFALETLNKLRKMTWDQVYRDNGLKWEKIASIAPPPESRLFIPCVSRNLDGLPPTGTAI